MTGACSIELENAVPRPVSPVYQNISTIAVDHAVAARGDRPAGVGRRAAHLHPGRDRGQGDPAVTTTPTPAAAQAAEDTRRRRHRRHRPPAAHRRQEGRAQARAAARRPGGDHHARGGRLPDPLRLLALAEQGGPAPAGRQRVHLVRELRHRAVQPDLVDGVRRHDVHHGRQRLPRAGVRDAAGDRHAPHDRRARAGAHLRTGALRDRDRGRRVLLALRLDRGPRLPDPERLGAADRVLAVDLDHHPGRGLEDRSRSWRCC